MKVEDVINIEYVFLVNTTMIHIWVRHFKKEVLDESQRNIILL